VPYTSPVTISCPLCHAPVLTERSSAVFSHCNVARQFVKKGGRSRKGPKWLGAGLTEAAAAGHSKGTYFGTQHHRMTGCIGYARRTRQSPTPSSSPAGTSCPPTSPTTTLEWT
jgi:hypothetical protein